MENLDSRADSLRTISLWYFNWDGPITYEKIKPFTIGFNEAEGSQHTDTIIGATFSELKFAKIKRRKHGNEH